MTRNERPVAAGRLLDRGLGHRHDSAEPPSQQQPRLPVERDEVGAGVAAAAATDRSAPAEALRSAHPLQRQPAAGLPEQLRRIPAEVEPVRPVVEERPSAVFGRVSAGNLCVHWQITRADCARLVSGMRSAKARITRPSVSSEDRRRALRFHLCSSVVSVRCISPLMPCCHSLLVARAPSRCTSGTAGERRRRQRASDAAATTTTQQEHARHSDGKDQGGRMHTCRRGAWHAREWARRRRVVGSSPISRNCRDGSIRTGSKPSSFMAKPAEWLES